MARASAARQSAGLPTVRFVARPRRPRTARDQGDHIAASGQPTLKDKFKATFQMTLLGNALLARLWESRRYRVLAFPGGRGAGEVIEVYPRATLRHMGLAALQVAAAGSRPARQEPPLNKAATRRKERRANPLREPPVQSPDRASAHKHTVPSRRLCTIHAPVGQFEQGCSRDLRRRKLRQRRCAYA